MSFLGDVWNAVTGAASDLGNFVGGVAHGIGDAAKAIADFVGDAGGLLNALKHIAEFLGDSEVGFLLGGLAGETLLQVADILGLSTVEQLYNFLHSLRVPRRLRGAEVDKITSVFKSPNVLFGVPVVTTVPTDRVWVTPFLNIMHRPFTVPASFLGNPLSLIFFGDVYWPLWLLATAANLLNSDAYLMNLGPTFYDGDATGFSPDFGFDDNWGAPGHTLIHEATHVWQGEHWEGWSYVWNAIAHSVYDYDYNPRAQWDGYYAEQQARMVEHWFSGVGPDSPPTFHGPYKRRAVNNPLFRFIEKNVWTGNQHDFSDERSVSDLNMSVDEYLVYLTTGMAAAGLTANGAPASSGDTGQGGGGSGISNPYTWGLGGMRPRVRVNRMM